jgi:hypothetical protein
VVTLPADSDNVMLAPDREDGMFTWFEAVADPKTEFVLNNDAKFVQLDGQQVLSHSGIATKNAEFGLDGTIGLKLNQGEEQQFIEKKRRKAE